MTDAEIEYSKGAHALYRVWMRSIVRQGTPSRLSWVCKTANGVWCYDFANGTTHYPRRRR